MRRILVIVRNALFVIVALSLLTLIVYLYLLYKTVLEIQESQAIVLSEDLPKSDQTTKIYASDYDPNTGDGTLLANIFVRNRKYVKLDEIPEKLKLCVLATEDARFYHHKGYDIIAMVRAMITNVKAGSIKEGASTITQQLVRNVFIPHIKYEKTINRKAHEILLAQSLEEKYTKEAIFEYYLNYIFLGAGAYGVDAAAETYFGKNLDELTLAECALISGLPQAPSDLNPFRNADGAKERRNKVLHNLRRSKQEFESSGMPLDLSSISYDEIEAALSEPIVLAKEKEPDALLYPWFTSYVREILYQKYGHDQVLRQGLIVITTLDTEMQKIAEDVVEKQIAAHEKSHNVHQAALVCVELDTGYVRAIVGGRSYGVGEGESVFNRATQAYRQPGSAFKPFNYATALEEGWKTTDWINDNPSKYPVGGGKYYTPHNFDHSNAGEIPLAWGMIKSKNVASVWLCNQLGPERIIRTARNMGLTSNLQPYLALTLGASEVYPIEMASAFATFPQQGMFIKNTPILYVMDQNGIVLEDNRFNIGYRKYQALSENTAYTMVQLMQAVNSRGTGGRANLGSLMPSGGKTGTTDEYRDAMYIGYTPYYSTAVWCGNDDHSRMRRMFGGTLPAKAWHDFNKRVIEAKNLPKKQFEKSPGVTGQGVPAYVSRGAETENTETHVGGESVIVSKPDGIPTPPSSGTGSGDGDAIKPRPPKHRGE
ncbi:PBP1A family penicillin-binding protein [bacterium]|nr:PBP1A family penicillin-binding protein [bacterium]